MTKINSQLCSLHSHFFGEPARPTATPASKAASKDLSRRCFVRTTVAVTAGTLLRLGTHNAGPRPVLQTTLSPEAALNELIEGNHRYVTGSLTAHEHDLAMLKAK